MNMWELGSALAKGGVGDRRRKKRILLLKMRKEIKGQKRRAGVSCWDGCGALLQRPGGGCVVFFQRVRSTCLHY